MIRLFSVKEGTLPKHDWFTKKATQRILTSQIDKGVIQSEKHANEYQTLYLTIEDNPLRRALMKLLKKDDSNMPVKLNAEFSRSKNVCAPLGIRRKYSDTFAMSQLHDLKNGKDLLKDKNSFVSKLVNNINEILKQNID